VLAMNVVDVAKEGVRAIIFQRRNIPTKNESIYSRARKALFLWSLFAYPCRLADLSKVAHENDVNLSTMLFTFYSLFTVCPAGCFGVKQARKGCSLLSGHF
jgi:hypothetical protein